MTSLKHGVNLYNEAEVFSLPIKNPNWPSMLLFDWFVHSGLILVCNELPQNSGERLGVILCLVLEVMNYLVNGTFQNNFSKNFSN